MIVGLSLLVFICGAAGVSYAKGEKLGYVDLRRAFYEYGKTKKHEEELNKLTEKSQGERKQQIEVITKLREEVELLTGAAKDKKQAEIDKKIATLQEYDRNTRQILLNKKNEMFREVIDDIQNVVDEIGKKGNYDYIFDSRNVMYAKEGFDLTDEVIGKLNK